jgi:hypothetical protein
MNVDERSLRGLTAVELEYALSQVRQVAPDFQIEPVARYVQEIAEAEQVVRAVPVDTEPMPVAFSPAWPSEAGS